MASAILSIEGGGQSPVEDNTAVIFADYDGTVIDTWTWDNKGSKTKLPIVPTHKGLVFEGWNWTLEDIKNDTTGQIITVGPYYHTESGLTEIDIEVNETDGMELQLSVKESNYTSLDWGDGTSIENIKYPSHVYEVPGKYTIKISGYSGQNILYHCNYYNNMDYQVNSYIIKAIRYNSGVDNVGYEGKGLKYITIPKTMIQIHSFENLGCTQLTIPENAKIKSFLFFAKGKNLKYIAMPKNYFNFEGQPTVFEATFRDCSSLQSIYIPENIIYISSDAFDNCSSLQSIYIPESVTRIGSGAFNGCSSLQSIYIPESIIDIVDDTFSDCSSLQSINIPNSVTSIDIYAFDYCSSINKAIISSSAEIGSNVYRFYNYTTFDFSGCSSIPVLSSIEAIGGGVPYVKVIYVPSDLYNEWIKATNWVVFKDKIKTKSEV